jgi:hypothetical protein
MLRMTRRLRVLRAAPRVAVMTLSSAHTRYVPAIRHNHRIDRRTR